MFNNKPSFYELEVQFEEIDQGGVVYHPNYFTYMERARNASMKELGFSLKRMLEKDFVFALLHTDIRFRAPARLHDSLCVVSLVETARSASIIVNQYILHGNQSDFNTLSIEEIEKSPQLCVNAKIKLGCIDTIEFKPKRIPDEVVEIIEKS